MENYGKLWESIYYFEFNLKFVEINMSERRSIRNWHRKKIMSFVFVFVILILTLATVAGYGNKRHAKPRITPMLTPAPVLSWHQI